MAYVAYPHAFLFAEPDESPQNKSSVGHYPWGHWLTARSTKQNGFVKVKFRWMDEQGAQHAHAWGREEGLQTNKLLEGRFVDIGQGDGCFLITLGDEKILIGAGERDNMHRFLRWQFNRKPVVFDAALFSHPDKDHYYGFRKLVEDENFSFEVVYHNGVVERSGGPSLGSSEDGMLTDVIETPEQLDEILDDPAKLGSKLIPTSCSTCALQVAPARSGCCITKTSSCPDSVTPRTSRFESWPLWSSGTKSTVNRAYRSLAA